MDKLRFFAFCLCIFNIGNGHFIYIPETISVDKSTFYCIQYLVQYYNTIFDRHHWIMLRLSEKKIGVRLTFITDKTPFPKKNGRNA